MIILTESDMGMGMVAQDTAGDIPAVFTAVGMAAVMEVRDTMATVATGLEEGIVQVGRSSSTHPEIREATTITTVDPGAMTRILGTATCITSKV